jgi:ketosteroid isomerase-like protein
LRKFFNAFPILAFLFVVFLAKAQDSGALAQADRSFVQALQQRNKDAAARLLDADVIWIDSNGKRLTRSQIVQNLPTIANGDVESQSRTYGNAAVTRAIRGRVNVLRVWVKRDDGSRLMLYQEVTQVEKSEAPGGGSREECINPCKTIPYEPPTKSEREAIAAWQGVMKAMAANDPDAYAPLIADEFTATDTYHDRPYTKSDRLAQMAKQKASGQHNAPPELLAAEMFDFGETVLMVAREQRPGAKSYFNTRMWVKRDNRWQMLFSFNTRIE